MGRDTTVLGTYVFAPLMQIRGFSARSAWTEQEMWVQDMTQDLIWEWSDCGMKEKANQ